MAHLGSAANCIATFIGIAGLLATQVAVAETKTVTPRGEFAQIDTRLAKTTIQILANGTADEKQDVIAKVKANPENYAPPVFYVLSHVLFADGEKDEGAFWFYAGQLRARVDANICADSSAGQAVGVLNANFGTPINQYTFQDIPKLEALVPKVVDWERKTPYNYDRRWINLHGMGAMMSGLGAQSKDASQAPLSYPKDRWTDIAEKTRTDYLADFRKGMAQIKSKK
jgi:hypothetical protein